MGDIDSGPLAIVKVKNRPRKPQSITVRKKRLGDGYVYRCVNVEPLYAGDEVTIEVAAGIDLNAFGPLIKSGAGRRLSKFIVSDTGQMKLVVKGKARSRVKIPIVEPPPVDPTAMELCGPGLYRAHAGLDDEPLRYWVDQVADAGMNHIRVILPARAWLAEPMPQSIFLQVGAGFYILAETDEAYLRRLRADLFYARKRGVVVQIDLFDWHILRHFGSWSRSEFSGVHNTLRYPMPGKHYTGRWENAVEHPLKWDWDYPYGSPDDRLQRDYEAAIAAAFRRVAEIVPAGHILGDGNELEGRTVSRRILGNVRDSYGPLAYGGTPLWTAPQPGETWADKCDRFVRDPMMPWIRYICLHGINRANALVRFSRLLPFLEDFPHIRVVFDTDGTGTGTVRGQSGRPTFEELLIIRDRCRFIADHLYGGFNIKTLGLEDNRALLEFWEKYA